MKIYSKSGIELLDIQVDDTSVRYRSIMKDDSLTLKFSHTETVNVPVGSYVNFEGQRYTLWLPENFKKHNTRNFEYTIVFGGWREALKLFKFKDLSSVPYRLKFSLTAKPGGFLQLLVDNMNVHDSGWTVGSYIDTSERTISFNHEYCADVLSRIAQEFNTEYDFEGKKIHLHKVEKFKNTPLALSYGRGNGFKSGVGRANDGDKQPIGRLYVQGGERNIDYSKYGSTTLLLPKSETLVLDGKTYRTDAEGMCVTRDGNDLIAEDSYDAKSIYPRRVGTVSAVEEIDAEQHFYDIIDASIPEELDYADYRIEGDKATISFQSGALAGREFDIEQTDKALTGYIHEERRFKIVPQELDGVIMPGGAFVPAVGDKYAIFNISMPASYVSDASMEMFEECAKYFAENEKQKFTFTGELDGIWARKEWLEIGGKIVPGGHVLFSDEQFLPDGEVIRITSIKDYVNFPYKPEITLSNTIVPGGLGSDLGGLEAEEVVTEELHKKAIRYSKRRWRDTVETMSLLEKALLNFDKGINPIFVQTMQLLVGDESLQFRFVNNKTNPSQVEHNVFYNAETKVLTSPGGIIQHMTLGVDKVSSSHKPSEYKFWTMAGYNSPPLTPESSYYLYAKCGKANSTGSFLLSETSIAMDAEAGFHHLLVGVLNSEFENERSFVTLYGFTEILPGRITTDQIVSADGKTYFDLVNGIIGGRLRFLSNGTEVDISDWATQLEDNLSGLGDHVGDFEDYLEGAFKDGIISAAEAKAIKSYINTIESEKAAIEATYNKLFVNPLLTGTPKSNLLQAKVDFFGHVTTLIDLINDVILDGLVKPSEVTQVNNAFADYRDAYALFSQRIQEANDAIQSAWGSQLQGQIDGLDGHIGDFEDYIEGAFKDGVISAAEAKAIKSYINTIESEKAAIQATYNKLFVNPLLTGTPKSNLLQAKVDFFGHVTTLIDLINDVILDGLVKPSEVTQVNNAFADYRDAYALFSQRIQEANDAIQSAWGSQLQGQIDGLDGHIGDFEDYIEGAFKDGVISAAEAKAIKSYINTIESEKAAIQATYNKLFVNPMLTGTPKSNLLQAKIDFFDNVTTLINLINHVILDGLVTSGEVAQVNNAFADYRDSYALFSQRIQEGNESIQNKIAGDATEALARANIAKAITDKFGTTIDGALIQTVMMLLREANSETNTAGISGIQGALRDNPAFWAGGTYEQAIGGTAKAIIRHDGTSKFTDAEITGVINALSGEIGNLSIQDGKLKSSYSETKSVWNYSKFPPEYIGERTVNGEMMISVDAVELNETYINQGIPNTAKTSITPEGVNLESVIGLFHETKTKLVDGSLSIEYTNKYTGVTTLIEVFSDGIYFNGQKFTGGGDGYIHPLSHPADMISAGTFSGIVKANNNTSYTTKQVRNMILSTGDAVSSQMANGDIWIKYE